jgi:hypothetical protein
VSFSVGANFSVGSKVRLKNWLLDYFRASCKVRGSAWTKVKDVFKREPTASPGPIRSASLQTASHKDIEHTCNILLNLVRTFQAKVFDQI